MNQGSGLNLWSSAWGESGEALKNSSQNRFQPTNLGFSEKNTSVWRTLSSNVWWLTQCSEVSKAHSCGKWLKSCWRCFHKYLYSLGPATARQDPAPRAITWICTGRGGYPPGLTSLYGLLCRVQRDVKPSQQNSCPPNASASPLLGWAPTGATLLLPPIWCTFS